jgi:para-nitrobenzyl esterase
MGDRLVVDTLGGAVRGAALPGGGRLFAGIPFAAPAVGDLRFRPPQPAPPWVGLRDAVEFPPAPLQGRTALFEGAGAVSGSEDCLYLNLWTPPGDGPHPVVVWIYGGGFDTGSASPPVTDGATLARQLDAVVVAANYRVGALGFLHLGDLGDGAWAGCSNVGLLDQVAALAWVHENIAAFGGDPGLVTAAGESAGAFSIGALLTMPSAEGLFQRAILQSGSTSRVYGAATGTAVAEDLLARLELDDPAGLVAVAAERIVDVQANVVDRDIGRRNLPGGRSWGVVLDGTVVPRDPTEAVAAGCASSIGLLIGANRDEARLFESMQGEAYRPADETVLLAEMSRAGVTEPAQLLAAYCSRDHDADLTRLRTMFLTDAIYRRPAARLAAAQIAAGGRAHVGLFAAEPFGPDLGACHAADVAFLFDFLPELTPENIAARDAFLAAWAQFIRTGEPGWPQYAPGEPDNARQIGGGRDYVTEPPTDTVSRAWDRTATTP